MGEIKKNTQPSPPQSKTPQERKSEEKNNRKRYAETYIITIANRHTQKIQEQIQKNATPPGLYHLTEKEPRATTHINLQTINIPKPKKATLITQEPNGETDQKYLRAQHAPIPENKNAAWANIGKNIRCELWEEGKTGLGMPKTKHGIILSITRKN